MNVILKCHLQQLHNFWRHLKLRIRIEIIILFVIFYSFFTDKLVLFFNELLLQPGITPLGISNIFIHTLLIIVVATTPFIYFNLFPRQKGLLIFSTQPMSPSDTLTAIMIYFFKYEIIMILISLPVFTALAISTGGLPFLYAVFIFVAFPLYSVFITHSLATKKGSKRSALALYFLVVVLYFIVFFILYWHTDISPYFSLFLVISTGLICRKFWESSLLSLDAIVYRFRPRLDQLAQKLSKLTYFNFPAIIPRAIRPLFIKDLLSYIRNKNYMRLKIISLLIYVLLLIIINIYYDQNFATAVSLLTFLFIWEHYSHQFNEKYVVKESRIFLKVLPLRYYQLSLAKFLSEFLFILVILMVVLVMTLIHGISWFKILNLLSGITLFSIFILYIITIIRIIFFDNPRFAGYAYHFLIIFTLVMIYNFYLVGPVITLLIIIYLNYISYRQFEK